MRQMQARLSRLALAVALLAGACGGAAPTPTAPTAPTPSQYVFTQVQGNVLDTAFRPLAGVRVEIVDGSHASEFVITDTEGRFSFSGGQYVDGIRFRAAKDGYITATVSGPLQFPWPSTVASLNISLDSVGAPTKIEPGAYTLTVIVDSACTEIPDELRRRTYSATIVPSRDHPNTLYLVDVTGPTVAPFGFGIGVAGNYLGWTIDGPAFVEHISPFTYLQIAGSGSTSLGASPTSTIEFPFSGSFEYCILRSEMGRTNNCYTTPADQRVAYSQCLSRTDQMLLARR